MELPKFKSYRLFITNRVGGVNGTYALAEFRLFDDLNGAGQNILTGGVATASSVFGSGYEASKAFDGDSVSRWASVSSGGPEWIRYDLPEAKAAMSLLLSLSTNPVNAPYDFVVQGSNDGGLTWAEVGSYVNFATAEQIALGVVRNLDVFGVGGRALLDTGAAATQVYVLKWVTGERVGVTAPDSRGDWSLRVREAGTPYLVVVTGPAGVRPQAHGPVTAEAMTW